MWDDLYPHERDTALTMAASRPPEAPEPPGFWTGVHKALVPGVMQGGARAAQFVGMAGAAIPLAIDAIAGQDNLTGEPLTDKYFSTMDETVNRAVDYWSLPTDAVGTAGRIAYGVAGMALPLMAAGGNPELLMGAQGMGTAMDLTKQGVDAKTAVGAGVVSAATTGLGMKLPMAGNTLAQSLALGVGGNVAVGVLDRSLIHGLLEHADYSKIAAQYKPFDPEQMAVEAVMGAAFGGLAHATKPKTPALTPDEHAALLTMNEVRTRDADTLTRPGDINALNAAHEAQAMAAAQLDRGEMVSIAHLVTPDAPTLDAARAMAFERLTADMRAELLAEAGNRAEPGEIAALKAEREALAAKLDEANSEAAFREEAKAQQEQGLSRKQAESAARKSIEQRVADLQAQAERMDATLERNRRAAQAEQDLAALAKGEIPERFGGAVEDQAEAITRGFQRRPIAEAVARMAETPEGEGRAPEVRPAGETAAKAEPVDRDSESAARLAAAKPDRLIRMDDGRDVRTADLMREMDAEFHQDITDAKAFEAAAQCFLQTGAA